MWIMHPIERAARAICADLGVDPDSNVDFEAEVRPAWKEHIATVCSALQAMRDPSRSMMEAGAEITRNVGRAESDAAYINDAANVWRFMIDAALSEWTRPD
jgi:hypothetical protein